MNRCHFHLRGIGIFHSRIRYLVFIGLVFYLLLFAAFSFFHAYTNDELGDTTCIIGLWVQHGQASALSVLLLSIVLASLPYQPFANGFFKSGLRSSLTARAPPISSYQ